MDKYGKDQLVVTSVVTNEDMLRKVNEDKLILNAIEQQKHCCMGRF